MMKCDVDTGRKCMITWAQGDYVMASKKISLLWVYWSHFRSGIWCCQILRSNELLSNSSNELLSNSTLKNRQKFAKNQD